MYIYSVYLLLFYSGQSRSQRRELTRAMARRCPCNHHTCRAGQAIMKAAADNLIPVTMELGGKSPNIYFSSIANEVIRYMGYVIPPTSVCVCIPPRQSLWTTAHLCGSVSVFSFVGKGQG